MTRSIIILIVVGVLGFFFAAAEFDNQKIIWTNAGIDKGRAEIQKKWDADVVVRERAEKLAIANRLKEAEATKARFDIEKKQMKVGYEKEITDLRSRAASAGSLRISAGVCAGFAAGANANGPSGGDEGIAATGILPEPYSGNITQLMLEADEFIASCRVAQNFIKKYGFAP